MPSPSRRSPSRPVEYKMGKRTPAELRRHRGGWGEGRCETCGARLEAGYGMAAGGMGVYEYCPRGHEMTSALQDPG